MVTQSTQLLVRLEKVSAKIQAQLLWQPCPKGNLTIVIMKSIFGFSFFNAR